MTAALAKSKIHTSQQEVAGVAASAATKSSMTIMAGAAAFIGIWAVACFAAAVLSHGPLAMIKGLFGALLG